MQTTISRSHTHTHMHVLQIYNLHDSYTFTILDVCLFVFYILCACTGSPRKYNSFSHLSFLPPTTPSHPSSSTYHRYVNVCYCVWVCVCVCSYYIRMYRKHGNIINIYMCIFICTAVASTANRRKGVGEW